MRRGPPVTAMAALILMSSTAAATAVPSSQLDQARDLLADGRPELACNVLEASKTTALQDVQALVLLGLCNEQSGRIEPAIGYYEDALKVVPEAQLVRARLAALYAVEGRVREAQSALETALAAAQSAVGRADQLAQLPREREASAPAPAPNHLSARMMVGRFQDSNVNAGSSSSMMTGIIGGMPLPLVISDSSRARADSGTRLAVQAQHLHPFGPNHALISRAELGATIHDNFTQYDRQTLGLATMLVYAEPRLRLMVQPSLNAGFDDGEFSTMRGALDLAVERRLEQDWTIFAAAGLAYRHNAQTAERSTWDGVLNIGLRYSLNDAFEVGAAYAVGSTLSGRATESVLSQGPEISLAARLSDDVFLRLAYGYEHAVYDETSAPFPLAGRSIAIAWGARSILICLIALPKGWA